MDEPSLHLTVAKICPANVGPNERDFVDAFETQMLPVTQMRHLFQKTMEAEFTDAVERLTGAKVVAFISGNNVSPDVASELFILDSSLSTQPAD